jgi:hypothetical protein
MARIEIRLLTGEVVGTLVDFRRTAEATAAQLRSQWPGAEVRVVPSGETVGTEG